MEKKNSFSYLEMFKYLKEILKIKRVALKIKNKVKSMLINLDSSFIDRVKKLKRSRNFRNIEFQFQRKIYTVWTTLKYIYI